MLACGTKYSAEEGIRKIDVRAGISGVQIRDPIRFRVRVGMSVGE